MNRKTIILHVLIVMVLLAGPAAFASGLGPATAINGAYQAEYRDITSQHTGDTYRIFIAHPIGAEAGKKYPAIYALDGNGTFGLVTDVARLMAFGQEIPSGYVIAVGYAVENGFAETLDKRYRDYTPTEGGELEQITKLQFDPANAIQPGGGPAFLKFLTEELKPALEAEYAIDPNDATLGGASLGGLFPTWVLLSHPESFQRYVIISPSIWWNGEEVWQWEEAAAAARDDIPATAFVTAGGLERTELLQAQLAVPEGAEGDWAEMMRGFNAAYDKHGWPKMAEITPVFAEKLQSRGYPGLTIHCHNLPDETHMSVPAGAWSRGLRYVYGHWRPHQ